MRELEGGHDSRMIEREQLASWLQSVQESRYYHQVDPRLGIVQEQVEAAGSSYLECMNPNLAYKILERYKRLPNAHGNPAKPLLLRDFEMLKNDFVKVTQNADYAGTDNDEFTNTAQGVRPR
ncbi:uncharacterized protein BJ212DRAFT_1303450 [Suillus subaureus]|uniref:Uncharacterized protein n=1 Tax=Suillus subaureus TaxID=48587 RepID=A0A9P7E018_9AGAM|nr:uncharacterized protein BJ212DRAFT_1303450 [Suillus subaureus]KAG1807488.1 hypothetical protein BJ212DRAFT_1303450 [Suillus subaureus]